ncbi:MAG: hypothetical protein N3A71_03865 [Candidatus Dojkabacteria bacterium]|nr:hypothetical protein [Candidatus Dojkabacteria bacterium]
MIIKLRANETPDAAFRRILKEWLALGVNKKFEELRYRIPEGLVLRQKRMKIYKTKRRRAAVRRKLRNKTV